MNKINAHTLRNVLMAINAAQTVLAKMPLQVRIDYGTAVASGSLDFAQMVLLQAGLADVAVDDGWRGLEA